LTSTTVAAVAAAGGLAATMTARETRKPAGSAPWPIQTSAQPAGTIKHQGGIALAPQDHITLVALDLLPQTDKAGMRRLMTLLTQDVALLGKGRQVPADPQPELGANPPVITVGFGPTLFTKLKIENRAPKGFAPLPSLEIDKLEDQYTDGDLLVQIAGNNALSVAHATRTLIRECLSFAQTRWVQQGFTHGNRNLMGQVDGTDNPTPGSEDFNNLVWMNQDQGWWQGGTQMVIRRIRMNLDTWDSLGRPQQEAAIGRRLSDGSPLSGTSIKDVPDFNAKGANGLPAIPEFAHIRRASATTLTERFYRRPFNYVGQPVNGGQTEAGMIWTAFSADLHNQYLPVQKRLAQFDLLNLWTTPIGSAVFAIPPAATAGEELAARLFA